MGCEIPERKHVTTSVISCRGSKVKSRRHQTIFETIKREELLELALSVGAPAWVQEKINSDDPPAPALVLEYKSKNTVETPDLTVAYVIAESSSLGAEIIERGVETSWDGRSGWQVPNH